MSEMIEHHLFGGNMTIMLPNNVIDVSDMRQVPDNQEVFVNPVTDQSIIIELLDYLEEEDESAIRTHFSELALRNEAGDSSISDVKLLLKDEISITKCSCGYFLKGEQIISKFNEASNNRVLVSMGLLRLSSSSTDILITMNDPVDISSESSSYNASDSVAMCRKDSWSEEAFLLCLKSLKVIDESFLCGQENVE